MSSKKPTRSCHLCRRSLIIDLTAEWVPGLRCQGCASNLICLDCFVDKRKHDVRHTYTVERNPDDLLSPLAAGWSMRQEHALLNGIERLGLENWEEIADKALLKSKTKEECKIHFEKIRVMAGGQPTPVEDRSGADEKLRNDAEKSKQLPGSSMMGYLPLREEFDNVYANDADILMADMVFDDQFENELEREQPDWRDLKLKVLRNYNLKVEEREFRKRYVLERGLLDFNRFLEMRRKAAAVVGVVDVLSDLDGLAKYMSPTEHEAIARGIVRERAIRNEVKNLLQYRAMGIRTLAEVDSLQEAAKRQAAGLPARMESKIPRLELSSSAAAAAVATSTSTVTDSPEVSVLEDVKLTDQELALCQKLNLSRRQYVVCRNCLIRESLKARGALSKARAKAVLTVDVTVTEALLDFLVKCEWVREEKAA